MKVIMNQVIMLNSKILLVIVKIKRIPQKKKLKTLYSTIPYSTRKNKTKKKRKNMI